MLALTIRCHPYARAYCGKKLNTFPDQGPAFISPKNPVPSSGKYWGNLWVMIRSEIAVQRALWFLAPSGHPEPQDSLTAREYHYRIG
jgi:hypothetical protein